MRIAYVNHSRFPTEKAHGLQTAQVCAAMASLGHQVTLLCPTIRQSDPSTGFAYYGLMPNFQIQQIKHADAFQSMIVPGFLGFWVTMRWYAKALSTYFVSNEFELLYVRSPLLLAPLLKTGMSVILELHALPTRGQRRFVKLCNRCSSVVCLTSLMRDELLKWGVESDRLLVEGDAVDLKRFKNHPATVMSRQKWDLPLDRTIVGYVGSFVTRETIEKGVRELIDAIARLSKLNANIFGWIVGGPDAWAKTYAAYAESLGLTKDQLRFQPHISPQDVPAALAACDVCVYPAPASQHPYFLRDTSPMKLFEYLAAGRPVVAADLPPLRDVFDETTVFFCKPGDSVSLAEAISDVLSDTEETQKRVEAGQALMAEHTWEARMKRILQRIS